MRSKACVATIKFLLYTDTLQIMSYFEFALMCSHVKSFYVSLLDPLVDLGPTASNFHGIEVDSTDQSRRHQFPRHRIQYSAFH